MIKKSLMNTIWKCKNYYELVIESPKYGLFIVNFDKKDHSTIIQYNWHIQHSGRSIYPLTNIWKNGKRTVIRMHMLIYPNLLVDHVDGNGLDNRRKNLRIATKQENNRNTRKRLDGKTSKYKGVCKHNNGFTAQISINAKRIYLGYFKNEIDAAICYNKAAIKNFGKFANINKLEK